MPARSDTADDVVWSYWSFISARRVTVVGSRPDSVSDEKKMRCVQCSATVGKNAAAANAMPPSSTPIIDRARARLEQMLERRRGDPGREREQQHGADEETARDAQQFDDDGHEKERDRSASSAVSRRRIHAAASPCRQRNVTETIRKRTFSRLPPVAMP